MMSNTLSKRRSISRASQKRLQQQIQSVCPFCNSIDVAHFHFHHIDSDRANNEEINLLMVCPLCHSKITHKEISLDDVRKRKFTLMTSLVDPPFIKVEIEAQFPGGALAWQQYLVLSLK